MTILYDFVFLLCVLFYLPIYLFKRKFHYDFSSRLGVLPKVLELNRPIWIHAVSVGEAMAIRGILDGLRLTFPEKRFVISTVTPTGNKVVKGIAGPNDFITYLPLDFSFIVKKVIDKINPALFIIAETEIWPNLISYLNKKHIPIAIVNARVSDSSFKGYLAIKYLLKPVLSKVNLFCAQTERDSARFLRLGVNPESLHVTGNLKFDLKAELKKEDLGLKRKLGLKPENKLLVAGSTHREEEAMVLNAYKELLSEFNGLRLLIAPRHPERASEIADLVVSSGFKPLRISKLAQVDDNPKQENSVFILDTVGDLVAFYALADIVFVGGSLVNKGGHNILEPAALGKPVLFGPHMFNFKDITDLFLKNNACIMVIDQAQLKNGIRDLLVIPEKRQALGEKGLSLTLRNQGATKRTLEYLKGLLL